ncbi:MAG: Protein-export membrane protein SecG [SAR92 bacterium MED-G29]|jgi:preprotein translocase subunit SecG|nr:preprotein translocase subunit SecG [Porticoccaceae bacterium]CAI8272734.1 MAG: Protein-export membrane protein SecG [SAR92 bacterium MED-G29]|tara:strand:+ start:3052 stop:3429 length:378 start_codon:yes stop_codon:yes gene_type:complete
MEQIILIFHFVVAIGLIALILLQQGKGAEAGASFGSGASQTVFGSGGGWNFFSKMTAILSTIFFVTSVSLALVAKNKTVVDEDLLPELLTIPTEAVRETDIPALETARDPMDDLSSGDVPAAPEQ